MSSKLPTGLQGGTGPRTDAVLNLLLSVSVLLAVATVGYAAMVSGAGDSYTEFYLLNENETGDHVAAGYPTEFELGERKPVVMTVQNQEREPVRYTVVVALQRVSFLPGADGSTDVAVVESEELRRFRAELGHGETWSERYLIEPTMTGEDLRLVFLLYRGDPPANPTVENAYREVHLWIDVSDTEGDRSVDAPGPEHASPGPRPAPWARISNGHRGVGTL